jgi:hypothetical protein
MNYVAEDDLTYIAWRRTGTDWTGRYEASMAYVTFKNSIDDLSFYNYTASQYEYINIHIRPRYTVNYTPLCTHLLPRYHVPTHHANPPSPIVTPKCHANPQAIANKNFGLNTVQMNKCCLNAVQATITLINITPVQNVNKLKCSTHAVFSFLASLLSSSFLAISFR